ncbi:Alpha/Beta hydrolase protein [Russula vinacea]|nr:Alpha/Beta hydrolase protein [Russula vinacea]
MHNLKASLFIRYDTPEKYDLAPFKTRNVRLQTADNETLGAWFIFSDPFYAAHKTDLLSSPTSSDQLIRSAVRTHPTILFLHGNGGTRVLPSRVQHYQAFASRLRANVFALDYRGYGDSTGTPSEAGSRSTPTPHGTGFAPMAPRRRALGTAVAVQFVSALEAEQGGKEEGGRERPRGVVLLAPFSNVQTLLDTYYIAGIVPLMAPLRIFPSVANFVKRFLVHRFDSLAKVVGLKVPLLIVHAENDWDIPHSHSQTLLTPSWNNTCHPCRISRQRWHRTSSQKVSKGCPKSGGRCEVSLPLQARSRV